MKNMVWFSDPHFNFFNQTEIDTFLNEVQSHNPDTILISGDIGEAKSILGYLKTLTEKLTAPIYFVMGNHDYYGNSIPAVRNVVSVFCKSYPDLHWLPDCGIVKLSETTALLGHGSWADGRLGNYATSTLELTDYYAIKEFLEAPERDARLKIMQHFGDEGAAYIDEHLPKAMQQYKNVVVVTHPPPFREVTRHMGKISDDNGMPHFSCKAVGDVLLKHCTQYPESNVTVLCGHTHGGGEEHILPNLRVIVATADYQMQVERVFVLK